MSVLSRFKTGDLVEVRSEAEILATLDERGMLDRMPFMPEMLRFCGQKFRVGGSAHKTCDTFHYSGNRRVGTAVHLEDVRCDGGAHGGCQADCLMFWKDAWLKPAGGNDRQPGPAARIGGCTRDQLSANTRHEDGERYRCQITELLNMSQPLAWWNPTQYLADIRKGNFSARHVLVTLLLAAVRRMVVNYPNHPVFRRIYDFLAVRFNRPLLFTRAQLRGPIAPGTPTPTSDLMLQAGDWVKVRPAAEIVATLANHKNRGLVFDTEMYPYCGGTFRVRGVVTRIIEEPTGRMMDMKNPCIKLDGVVCKSEYSEKRFMCPRAIFSYWRPLWLEKVNPPDR